MWKNKRRFLLLGLLLSMILVGCSAEHNELMERKKVAVIMKSTESAFFKAVSAEQMRRERNIIWTFYLKAPRMRKIMKLRMP